MASDVLSLSRRFRAQLDAQDEKALARLIDAYRLMYQRLEGHVDALLLEIERDGVTSGKVFRLARYKSLMGQIEQEVSGYSAFLRTELNLSANAALKSGLSHSTQLTMAILQSAGITARLDTLPVEAVKQLLGFLQEGSPVYDRIDALAGVQAERVRDALIEGMGLGYGPEKTARSIQDAFGMGLTDSLRWTRTVDLYAYREASRANYMANSDIVSGWQWSATLDDTTCMACLAEDGTIHSLDETLDGHWNCRCSPVPYIEGLTEARQNGEEWFGEQSEETQKTMMGPGRFSAWQEGKFGFSDLATHVPDDVLGAMWVETALKDLIAEGE